MKKMKSAAMLIAAALSVAACSKSEDVSSNATTETVTLNEGEAAETTNFTDDANVLAPDAAATDNALGLGGNEAGSTANTQ